MNTGQKLTSMTNIQAVAQPRGNGSKQPDLGGDFLRSMFGTNEDFREPKIKTITPEIASQMLTKNTKNRSIRKGHTFWLSKQMTLGLWRFSGNTILFDSEGHLCDGQHTLNAIIDSGCVFQFVVMSGVEPEVISILDTGIARSASCVLQMNGITSAIAKASICRRVLTFKAGQIARSIRADGGVPKRAFHSKDDIITNAIILEEVSINPAYGEASDAARIYYDHFRGLTTSQYGLLHFLFTEKDADDAYEFLSKVSSGIGLNADSPMYHFRRKMEQQMSQNVKFSPNLLLYWAFYCWNKFRKGDPLKMLKTPQDTTLPDLV